jgi:hypothetical protein
MLVNLGQLFGRGGLQFGMKRPSRRVSAARMVFRRLTGVAGCS